MPQLQKGVPGSTAAYTSAGLSCGRALQGPERYPQLRGVPRTEKETHWLAEQKQQELARVRDAWGLKDTVEGEAFNRDIQEAKKQARIVQREKDKQEREEQKQREQEARQKAAKDAEKRRKQVSSLRRQLLCGCPALPGSLHVCTAQHHQAAGAHSLHPWDLVQQHTQPSAAHACR